MTHPNFMIIGAAKAGTTSLYHYLRQHPQIYMTPTKETNYFALAGHPLNYSGPGDQDYITRFSITTPEGYAAQFADVREERAIGEASPLYLYDAQTPARLKAAVPDVRLIAVLREPVTRAYSAFSHLIRDGREPATSFADALALEEERITAGWEHIWHYVRMGRYAEQLRRYQALFAPEQLRVYLHDDLLHRPAWVMQDLLSFLEVDPSALPDQSVRHNVSSLNLPHLPPLLPEVHEHLDALFTPERGELAELLGRDLRHWRAQVLTSR
jgi:hypothetical protein